MTEQRTESNIPWIRFLMAATSTSRTLTHVPRILALDGGGVRGLSSLLIVQRLMHEVHRIMTHKGQVTADGKLPLPCEYFDLICGTSTGGLIAIMLGRLRMVCKILPRSSD
jgi:patatin-like phospholipase/acyl hydrolase